MASGHAPIITQKDMPAAFDGIRMHARRLNCVTGSATCALRVACAHGDVPPTLEPGALFSHLRSSAKNSSRTAASVMRLKASIVGGRELGRLARATIDFARPWNAIGSRIRAATPRDFAQKLLVPEPAEEPESVDEEVVISGGGVTNDQACVGAATSYGPAGTLQADEVGRFRRLRGVALQCMSLASLGKTPNSNAVSAAASSTGCTSDRLTKPMVQRSRNRYWPRPSTGFEIGRAHV